MSVGMGTQSKRCVDHATCIVSVLTFVDARSVTGMYVRVVTKAIIAVPIMFKHERDDIKSLMQRSCIWTPWRPVTYVRMKLTLTNMIYMIVTHVMGSNVIHVHIIAMYVKLITVMHVA
jgi:hypothetical protein